MHDDIPNDVARGGRVPGAHGWRALVAVLAVCAGLGFGTFAAEAEVDPQVAPGTFTIHFENVELPTFVKFISKVTGKKFVFSDRVAGTVTVVSPVPVTADEAYKLFESVLAVRGLTMIDDGVVTRLVPLKEARTAGGRVFSDGAAAGGFATRLLPLRHVDVEQIASVLEPMVSNEGSLVVYPGTNTVIVSDVAANLDRVANVVAALDLPSHEEGVEVIALTHADASRLAEQITDILTVESDGQPPRPGKGAGQTAARTRFRIVPDERTNALIVVAAPADIRRIRSLAESLDSPLEPGDERVNVYYARYADSAALVEVLSAMLTGRRVQTPVGRGMTPAQVAAAAQSALVKPDISISADPATNAVIIDASIQDYRMILNLLRSLDIARPQVFVEAIIAEVSFDRSRALGFEFQAGGDVGDGVGIARTALQNLNPALTNPAGLAGLILAATSNRTIRLPDGTEVPAQVALFRALAAESDINVLSAPTLLTLDNQEARIIVGENVPFVTSRGIDLSNVDNVFTTVERRDVGIKLTITPQVSEGDIVILEIEEEVSAVVPSALLDANTVGPTTTIRAAQTTVSVQDGRTAVIGGLISNATRRRVSKVPILGDIPLLGRLFRTDEDDNEKVNLIVFLTPHIVRNPIDLETVSRDRKSGFHDGAPGVRVPFPDRDSPEVIPGDGEEPAPVENPPGAADDAAKPGTDDPVRRSPAWPGAAERSGSS